MAESDQQQKLMTTQEEIAIRLGIDSKAVRSGLNTVSTYLKQWQTRKKSDEENYTTWWKAELKKREEAEVSSAVRASSRSNRARQLLRQRAASRAGALSDDMEWLASQKQPEQATDNLNKAKHLVTGLIVGKFVSILNEIAEKIRSSEPEEIKAAREKQRISDFNKLTPESTRQGILNADDAVNNGFMGGAKLLIAQAAGEIANLAAWLGRKSSGVKTSAAAEEKLQKNVKALVEIWGAEKEAEDAVKSRKEEELKALEEIRAENEKKYDQEIRRARESGNIQEQMLKRVQSLGKEIQSTYDQRRKMSRARDLAFDDMSNLSMSDAASITDAARGSGRLPGLHLSNKQMDAVDRYRLLEIQSQQAKLDGNNGLAWNMTRSRLNMLKEMPWLKDAERNPMRAITESLEENSKNISELLSQAKTIGLNVSIVAVPLK